MNTISKTTAIRPHEGTVMRHSAPELHTGFFVRLLCKTHDRTIETLLSVFYTVKCEDIRYAQSTYFVHMCAK